jgi:hypothetical protein
MRKDIIRASKKYMSFPSWPHNHAAFYPFDTIRHYHSSSSKDNLLHMKTTVFKHKEGVVFIYITEKSTKIQILIVVKNLQLAKIPTMYLKCL